MTFIKKQLAKSPQGYLDSTEEPVKRLQTYQFPALTNAISLTGIHRIQSMKPNLNSR